MIYRFRGARKTCEGSLHPQPEGWGIRDPPRSRSNKSERHLNFDSILGSPRNDM